MAASVALHKYILQEFILHNEFAEPGHAPLQLKPEIRFQVFPQKDKQPIQTEMSIEIGNMDDGSSLYMKLRMRGLFLTLVPPGETPPDAKEFHKQAFLLLFNCVRAFITGATLMGGMPPFHMPPISPDNLNLKKDT